MHWLQEYARYEHNIYLCLFFSFTNYSHIPSSENPFSTFYSFVFFILLSSVPASPHFRLPLLLLVNCVHHPHSPSRIFHAHAHSHTEKTTSFVTCLRPHNQSDSTTSRFSPKFTFWVWIEICRTLRVWLSSDKNNRHCTWRPTYIYDLYRQIGLYSSQCVLCEVWSESE